MATDPSLVLVAAMCGEARLGFERVLMTSCERAPSSPVAGCSVIQTHTLPASCSLIQTHTDHRKHRISSLASCRIVLTAPLWLRKNHRAVTTATTRSLFHFALRVFRSSLNAYRGHGCHESCSLLSRFARSP